jgi:hypothetical protein
MVNKNNIFFRAWPKTFTYEYCMFPRGKTAEAVVAEEEKT